MELRQIIDARKRSHAQDDQLGKLLIELEKLDGKRDENLYRLIEKVQQVENELRRGSLEDAHLRKWLDDYSHTLHLAATKRHDQFGEHLADMLKPMDIKLRGQYPRLYAGLFQLDLSFDKGRCRVWYGPQQEDMGEIALDAAKVAEKVRKLRNGLGSGLEPQMLLRRVQQAYRHARLDYPEGPLPVLALLPYLALLFQNEKFRNDPRHGHYSEYVRADFSFDLYQLRGVTPNLHMAIATRQQTEKRKDFLWVPKREDDVDGEWFTTIDMREEKL